MDDNPVAEGVPSESEAGQDEVGETSEETEAAQPNQEKEQTKLVEFGELTFNVPIGYRELSSEELGTNDDSTLYYVDDATGDGICIHKGVLPQEVTGESMILSLKSALINTPGAFGIEESEEVQPKVSPDTALPIYQIDDFIAPDGRYYAFRSIGYDLSTYYIVYAWSSSDNQEHLSGVVDTVQYSSGPDFELATCVLIDAFGEDGAKAMLLDVFEQLPDDDLEELMFAGAVHDGPGTSLITELAVTVLKERRGGNTESTEQSSTRDSSQSKSTTGSTSLSQQNALAQAKRYLELMPFSHKGLVEQLEYEGYSTSDAEYAADNCGADWYEQAALKAQDYEDLKPFSHQGLVEQLEYEGFTHSEAEHGVNAIGL